MLDRRADLETRKEVDRLRSTNERARKATMEALEKEEEGRVERERVKSEAIREWCSDGHFSTDLAAKVAKENERLRSLPPPPSVEEGTRVIEVQFSASGQTRLLARKRREMTKVTLKNLKKGPMVTRRTCQIEAGSYSKAVSSPRPSRYSLSA